MRGRRSARRGLTIVVLATIASAAHADLWVFRDEAGKTQVAPTQVDPRYQLFYKGTTKHHAVRRIRFVTPDVAIVDIDNEIRGVKTMPAGIAVPPDGVVKTQLMEVFVRRNGRWWVEAYHNVDTKPAN